MKLGRIRVARNETGVEDIAATDVLVIDARAVTQVVAGSAVAVVRLSNLLVRVPYFSALRRFDPNFAPAEIDLLRYSSLEYSQQDEFLWQRVVFVVQLAVDGQCQQAGDELRGVAKRWSLAPNQKKSGKPNLSPAAEIPHASPTTSGASNNNNSSTTTRSKKSSSIPVLAQKKKSSSTSTTPPQKPNCQRNQHATNVLVSSPPNDERQPDFLVLWPILYSIADYWAFDELKRVLVDILYSLAHDLDCGCASCVGTAGVVLKIAMLVHDVIGLEAVLEDCVFVMSKMWHKVYAHALFPNMPVTLRESVSSKVCSSIGAHNILCTLSRVSLLRTRPHFSCSPLSVMYCNQLDVLEGRVQHVLGLADPPPPPPLRGGVKSKTAGKSATHLAGPDMLKAVWDSDASLRNWAATAATSRSSTSFLLTSPWSVTRRAKTESKAQPREMVESFLVHEFFERFLVTLRTDNAVAYLRVLEGIRGDCLGQCFHVEPKVDEAEKMWEESEAGKTLRQVEDACVGFVAKRWMNVDGLKSVPMRVVERICVVAGITKKEYMECSLGI